MPSDDSLKSRGSALENEFFNAVDAKLIADLRAQLQAAEETKSLKTVTGVQDEQTVQALVNAGVSATTYPALRLFPLVAVAWADGALEPAEVETVMDVASKHGVGRDSSSGKLLEAWLSKNPGSDLFNAWESFAIKLVQTIPESEAASVKEALLKEVKQVAQASGGILGWAAISSGESKVMQRIEKALTR